MTIYPLTVTAVAFILAALLLREKVRRTEAAEEAEVLREQFKDLRSIIQNERAEYMRAYNTLHEAGYTDEGHALWTPPDRLENSLKWALKHRNVYLESRCQELAEECASKTALIQEQGAALKKLEDAAKNPEDHTKVDIPPQHHFGTSDDWPPYGHGIEAEAKAGDE